MRVVAILGGLGSQMFKYAFFLYLREKTEDECYISTIPFQFSKMWNGYELNRIFGIEAPEFDTEKNNVARVKLTGYADYFYEYCKLLGDTKYCYQINRGIIRKIGEKNVLKNLIYRIKQRRGEKSYLDVYDEKHWRLKGNILYDEFNHTSDRYIKSNTIDFKKVFVFPDLQDERNKRISTEMFHTESVAMHIRRSDHLYDNQSLFENGYFRKAVDYIIKRTNHAKFYIFSDDLEWCTNHLDALGLRDRQEDVIFVDWNTGEDSFRDMQLMTYCQHNILAISSFSWWGYYLSKHDKKIVCAPKGYWFDVGVHF